MFGMFAVIIMVVALVGLGRQCEKTKQAKREAEAIKQDAIRTKAATNYSVKRAQEQTKRGADVDKKRDAMLKSKGDEQRKKDYMDAVRGWHK